ncbi:MAG TPA: LytTR family DNA-binding domain-containing protein [Longimicrobium sp.]|nr:LytTR family DNA-binding domain-containing protein [Longimicrobium sp.]
MRTLHAVIVDDEPLGRERVRALLRDEPGVTVVGECADGPAAVEAVRRLEPDLLFLDVQMPGMDGFAVLEALGPRPPAQVIFVTAYDRYAVRAFEVNALDYLLKPVDPERLGAAVRRAVDRAAHAAPGGADPRLEALLEMVRPRSFARRIVVREGGSASFVAVERVGRVEADGNHVRIHVEGRSYLLREALREIERRLDPERFVRVNRSALVNLDHVERVEPWFRGEYVIILRDGTRLTSSRTHGSAFRSLLQ